jgi:hypothetical protein
VIAECGLGNEQYPSEDDCHALCELLPRGTNGDLSGNTVACRAHWIGLLDGTPESEYTNCRFGGPYTQGQCSPNCTMFCQTAEAACNIPDSTQQFESENECQEVCGEWLDDGDYHINAIGDTFACRAKHLVLAIRDPLQHCDDIREAEDCVNMGGMGGMGGLGGLGGLGGMGGMGGMGMGGLGGGGIGGAGGGGAGMGGT